MPDITAVNRPNTYGVQLELTYDAQWSDLEVWAPEVVREADIPAYYKLVKSQANADIGGVAQIDVTYEDLRMKGSLQVYVKVVGVRAGGREAIREVNATLVTRSNTIMEEFTAATGTEIADLVYPSEPQVPFGFDADFVEVYRLPSAAANAEVFVSYNGLDDHMHLTANEPETKDSLDGNVGYGIATRVFLRTNNTAGVDVRVRAKRPDIDKR